MRNALVAALACAVLTACTEGTSPGPSDEALVAIFTRTADSLSQQGDSSGFTYGMAADLIRAGARPTSVTVMENGVATPWVAVAQRFTVPSASCNFPTNTGFVPGTTVLLPPPACSMQFAPVVFAWRASEPTRMLSIVAPDGQSTAGLRTINPSTVFSSGTSLTFAAATLSDRVSRQIFFASSGTISVTRPASTAACTEQPRLPTGAAGICAVGDFSIGFDLTLSYPSDSLGGAPAAPQRLVMTPRAVAGVVVQLTSVGSPVPITIPRAPVDSALPGNPPTNLPPTLARDTLTGTLTASVASGAVTFTLEMRNQTARTQPVLFGSSQRIDVRVSNAAGAVVYVWSADKLFAQGISVDTLGPGATRSYRAEWNSPPSGTFRALGFLTSANTAAVGTTSVTVP